jgi:hypothetical protein
MPSFSYIENRDNWAGVNAKELQSWALKENGVRTDILSQHQEVAALLSGRLSEWESRYPRTEPVDPDQEVPAAEVEQLKSLGYLQ